MITESATLERGPTENWSKFQDEMHRLEREVSDKFKELDDLNKKFKSHQEQSFYRVFLEIMERLTNELGLARQRYDDIDKQLEKDGMVARLNRELFFFRQECIYQHQQNDKLKREISRLKGITERLGEEKQEIRAVLFKKRLDQSSEKYSREGECSVSPLFRTTYNGRYSKPIISSATTTNPEQWVHMRSSSFQKDTGPLGTGLIDKLSEGLMKLEASTFQLKSLSQKEDLTKRLQEIEASVHRIKCKLSIPIAKLDSPQHRITTKSTEKDTPKHFKESPLRYSSRSKRLKRALPLLVNDSEPGYD